MGAKTPSSRLYSNDAPYISQKCVEQALRDMIDSRPPAPNPLERLLLVDLALNDVAIPSGDQTRWYALQNIIVGLIEQEFTKLRTQLGLPLPQLHWKIDDYAEPVRIETGTRNANAITWSLLYHRAVRTDLDISQEVYSEWVGMVDRTYRRYQSAAILRLTKTLIAAEHQARRDYRRRRLTRELPSSSRVRVFGRMELLESVRASFDFRDVKHLYLTGSAGIGKTTVAQEYMRTLIDAGAITDLIWIERPRNVSEIRQSLTERLIREDTRMSVRDILLASPHQIAIVCDGIDGLVDSQPELEAWLREVDHAQVILTSGVYLPITSECLYVALQPLDYDASLALVCDLIQVTVDDEYGQEMTDGLWQEIGGNPRAIRTALARLEVETWQDVRQNVYQDMFDAVFENQRASAQIIWCICALQPHFRANVEDISRFWLEYLEHGSFSDLCRALVMHTIGDTAYQLTEEAARYIRHAYQRHTRVREIVDALVQHLDSQVQRVPEMALPIAQHVLLDDWIGMGADRRIDWIRRLCRLGIKHGYALIWRMLLETCPEEFETDLMLAVCLRRLGEWRAADQAFERLVASTGKRGEFVRQAHVLLEWGILARMRGEYARAEVMLQRVETTCHNAQLDTSELYNGLVIERAQIASDRQQPAEVLRLLEYVQQSSPRLMLLKSEAAIDQHQPLIGRELAQQVLKIAGDDHEVSAAALNLIGRAYKFEGQLDAATHAFMSGLTLLEQSSDLLGTARMRGNLGATLLEQGEYAQARRILQRAQDEFTRLGDTVGVAAMRHNLIILNTRASKRA